MQKINDNDLQINYYHQGIKNQSGATNNAAVYPIKPVFTTKKSIKMNNQGQAAQNLQQFKTTIMNDPVMLALEKLSKNNQVNSNIQIMNTQKTSLITSKTIINNNFTSGSSERYQILSRSPSNTTNIPQGQFDINGIGNRDQLIQNKLNDSNNNSQRSSRQSLHLISNYPKPNMHQISSLNNNYTSKEIAPIHDKNIEEQKLKHQLSLQHNNKKIIQKMTSLNIESEKMKELNIIISNVQNQQAHQPFLKEHANENAVLLSPQSRMEFKQLKHINLGTKTSTASTTDRRKQSNEFNLISNHEFIHTNENQDHNQNSNLIQNKINNQNNSLNATYIRKPSKSNNLNKPVISNISHHKLSSEGNEDQLQKVINSSNLKTGDNESLLCSSNISNINGNNRLNKSCSNQIKQLGDSIIFQSNQYSFINPIESKNIQTSQISNQKNQQQDSLKISEGMQTEDKTNNILSDKGQKNSNISLGGSQLPIAYLTNYQTKSSISSRKSSQTNIFSSKNKPFYHPFSHQSTASSGEDQSLPSQLFLSNLSKYHPCYSTQKPSNTSFRKSLNSISSNPVTNYPQYQHSSSQGPNQPIFIGVQKNNQIQNQQIMQQFKSKPFTTQIKNQSSLSQQNKGQQTEQQQKENYVNFLNGMNKNNDNQFAQSKFFNQKEKIQILNNQSKLQQQNISSQDKDDTNQENKPRINQQNYNLNETKRDNNEQQSEEQQDSRKSGQRDTNYDTDIQKSEETKQLSFDQIDENKDTLEKEKEDDDYQTNQNNSKLKKGRHNLSNLLMNINMDNLKGGNNQWGKIFQIFMDSKEYLLKSKRLIPQKRKNLLFEYKQNGNHKQSNSLTTTTYVQNLYQTNNKNIHSQNQEAFQKQRNSKSIQDVIFRDSFTENNFANINNILNSNLVDKKTAPTKQQQIKLVQPLSQSNKQSARNNLGQITNSKIALSQSPSKKNVKVDSSQNDQQKADSKERSSPSIIRMNQQLNNSLLGMKKDQNFMNNTSNNPFMSTQSSNVSPDNQMIFMTYRDRLKANDQYQSGQITKSLIDNKKIDEDPEIADLKIKLSKYFMDENISILEKRNNFKDIQALYTPENKKFNENICLQILPFLNNMKNFFLKIDFYNANQSQNYSMRSIDSKSKINRCKTGNVNASELINNQIQQFNQGEIEESQTSLMRGTSLKVSNPTYPSQIKISSKRNIVNRYQTMISEV